MNVPELFGSLVFDDESMREKLPKDIYKSLHKTIEEGKDLDINVANIVANAMKDWALEKGATHYTHWFQPMTGITAEKHDSFLSPQRDGKVIMEFSGKELIKGEPDASSFPSGGLRDTYEARGYTAWDPTSYAFIKGNSLCIPTVFCSFSGEVLDKKTPLLKSMERISEESIRILKFFGHTNIKKVSSTVGPEQEYFIIDKELFNKRKDLIFTGRTLFGAKAPKGQELDDHYFGVIKPRVQEFMNELNVELWKLGIYAKTEHNEVAPSQHELAPVFATANTATDHNQLTMEIMKKLASKHNLTCLLHEKPFAGINGSGKHNNWSLSTNTGINLLEPGKNPVENKQFLIFLSAFIKAVDEHQDLIRYTAAGAGNDHRLGASEAPPAIVSMFLGELDDILRNFAAGTSFESAKTTKMLTGVHVLPDFTKDTTDRNRTSPLAFTSNKFEFRMLGSSFSIASPNIILNTIVADALSQFADRLDKSDNVEETIDEIIKETYREHSRIIFNGNNYSDEWVKEAEKRGLLNLKSTVDAIPYLIRDENIELLTKHNIFSKTEIMSRYEISLENYCKILNIEALTMLDMAKKEIIPAVFEYSKMIADELSSKKSIGFDVSEDVGMEVLNKINKLLSSLNKKIKTLEENIMYTHEIVNSYEKCKFFKNSVLQSMQELRIVADELETIVGKKYWPFPTYSELLYSV